MNRGNDMRGSTIFYDRDWNGPDGAVPKAIRSKQLT